MFWRNSISIFQFYRPTSGKCHWRAFVWNSTSKTTSNLLDQRLEGFLVVVEVIRLPSFEQRGPSDLPVRRLLEDYINLCGLKAQLPSKSSHIMNHALVRLRLRLSPGQVGSLAAPDILGHVRVILNSIQPDLAVCQRQSFIVRPQLSAERHFRRLDETICVSGIWSKTMH